MRNYLRKIFFVFLASFLSFFPAHAQSDTSKKLFTSIDDITNSRQLENFLKSLDPAFSTFHVNDSLQFLNDDCRNLADSLRCSPWFKADIDNNGYTDIVVIGGWDNHAIFCILDSGNNRYAINRLTRKIFQNCTFAVAEKIDNQNLLLHYSLNEQSNVIVDTLIFRFGDFVEYHRFPKNYKIEKIEFAAHGCSAQCPQFRLTIDSNRDATYNANLYNKISGDFEGTIDDTSFSQLMKLLNYIDFARLKNNYIVNWQNDQNCTLTITYDNGKTKTIRDNGLLGTFGLERVYQILFNWRDEQQWTKILPGEKRTERTSE